MAKARPEPGIMHPRKADKRSPMGGTPSIDGYLHPDIAYVMRTKLDTGRRAYRHLDGPEQLFILWAWSQGWHEARTAELLQCHQTTVAVFKRRVRAHPLKVLSLPVVWHQAQGKHWCKLCGAWRDNGTRAAKHVLSHILPDEYVRGLDLSTMMVRQPL